MKLIFSRKEKKRRKKKKESKPNPTHPYGLTQASRKRNKRKNWLSSAQQCYIYGACRFRPFRITKRREREAYGHWPLRDEFVVYRRACYFWYITKGKGGCVGRVVRYRELEMLRVSGLLIATYTEHTDLINGSVMLLMVLIIRECGITNTSREKICCLLNNYSFQWISTGREIWLSLLY